MLTDDLILSKINAYLEDFPFNRKPQSLYEPIRYVLSIGGKRIRPALALLAYNLFKDDAVSPPCTSVGMPIRPYYRATRCWFWLISWWHNVMQLS